MNDLMRSDHTNENALDSLLTVWAQSHALSQSRADEIQVAVTTDAVPKWAQSVGLPSQWWFGFAQDMADVLTQASRRWSKTNDIAGAYSI